MLLITRIFALATFVLALLTPPASAAAPPRRNFIRDAEIENTIRSMATPLFQAAGLDSEAVHIHIIVDPSLNAFVAGGQNLFLHTGLLLRVDNPSQLIGVMAHETGHISGGHLARMEGQMGNVTAEAIAAMLLGAAVGVASGRGDAAAAIMMGGQSMAMRNILAFSRTQESSADQAGLKFLDTTRQSATGMLEFMEILGDQEMLVTDRQDPYVRTHPLTRDRVSFIRDWVDHSQWTTQPVRPEYVEPFRRMRAKLFAFLESPVRTFQRFKETDTSLESRYARAVAAYRKPDLPLSLTLIDGLIAQRPNDPYFHELKGQMLFENARGAEAIAPYREAVRLLPNNALLQIELAQVETEQDDLDLLKDATTLLGRAVAIEPENLGAWRFMGIAYGRQNNEGMASYAMAEAAMLEDHLTDANFLANKAERLLPKSGPIWLRIQDIKNRASEAKRERDR